MTVYIHTYIYICIIILIIYFQCGRSAQCLLTSITQLQHLSRYEQVNGMEDNSDAKKTVTTSLPEDWTPGHPRIVWMKTSQDDLKSHNLTLTEAINTAHNRPLWQRVMLQWRPYSDFMDMLLMDMSCPRQPAVTIVSCWCALSSWILSPPTAASSCLINDNHRRQSSSPDVYLL